MKSIFDQLTKKEKDALAHTYDTDGYKAIKRVLELERLNAASKLIDVPANEIAVVARIQGQAEMCKSLHIGIKKFYKEYNKN